MKKIIALLLISFGLHGQGTLLKLKQLERSATDGSLVITTGTAGILTYTSSIDYSKISGVPTLTAYVPYTGATSSVNLGANSFSVGAVSTLSQVVTNTISANSTDSLSFYTNAIERLKIKSDGTFRFLSTSSTNTASGSMWYNVSSGTGSAAPTGFTFYSPTNSFWERVATFRNQSTGLQIQLSNSTASMAGWLKPMRNQGVGIQDSSGTTGLRVDQGGKVVINPASTSTHVANLTVLGTFSASSSGSVLGTFNASDIRSYGGNHLSLNAPAANVLIGTGGNVYAAINSSGMNVGNSSAPGGATLRVIGTMSVSSTATLANTNIKGTAFINDGSATTLGYDLEVNKSINGGVESWIRNNTSGTAAFAQWGVRTDGTTQLKGGVLSGGYTDVGLLKKQTAYLLTAGTSIDGMLIGHQSIAKNIIFINGGTATTDEAMRIDANKRVGINNASPTATLHVGGTFSASSTSSVNGLQLVSGGYSVTTKGINITAGDAATIDSPIGRFRKDNSGTTFVLTNSQITANSIITLQVVTAGLTGGKFLTVQAGAGSATITFEDITTGVAAAPSADMDVNFMIMN